MGDRWMDIPYEARYGKVVRFANGADYYDNDAKEFVVITNGTCTKPHDSATYDGHMSNGEGCLFAPSEAVALRVVNVTKTGDPIVGYTYRKVRAEALRPADGAAEFHSPFTLLGKVRKSRKVGRV